MDRRTPTDAASETRRIEVGPGVIRHVARVFEELYGDRTAILVADRNTFAAAGRAVSEVFGEASHPLREPVVFDEPALYAEYGRVLELEAALDRQDAVPVAVGAGTINDLTKLAAHRVGRPYVAVATAASMDGYTAFGASITREGSKQTFSCPAPEVVLADLEVLCQAPPAMNAAGYADLLAKTTAGADWLLADGLGEEPLCPAAWDLVQGAAREALADPEGVRQGRPEAVRRLTEGLLASGLAMQQTRSSRPASGAEHQFSHLWDMEGHRHEGHAPSHGFKVAIGTLAVARLYEALLEQPLEALDVDRCCAAWPDTAAVEREIDALFDVPELARKAREETAAKWVDASALRSHLQRVRDAWPELRDRLRAQLGPVAELEQRLASAGVPTQPEAIGITRARLRRSYRQAYHIRRRYTVLDLAVRAGLLEESLSGLFDER